MPLCINKNNHSNLEGQHHTSSPISSSLDKYPAGWWLTRLLSGNDVLALSHRWLYRHESQSSLEQLVDLMHGEREAECQRMFHKGETVPEPMSQPHLGPECPTCLTLPALASPKHFRRTYKNLKKMLLAISIHEEFGLGSGSSGYVVPASPRCQKKT